MGKTFLKRESSVASGKKNYFRHSFQARKHPDIVRMIEEHGKDAYFNFFALVEVCAEKASDKFPEDAKFVFRRSTLCHELLVTNSRLSRHLLAMTPSLVDEAVVTEKEVVLLFPKLRKYVGKYEVKLDSNSPNKRKEKERKEKEIKLNSETEIEAKKILPSDSPQENLKKPSPLSVYFSDAPEIQEWLDAGFHETHLQLLKKYSHHEVVDLVAKAFAWATPRNQKAEGWLYTFVSNKSTNAYGANRPEQKKPKLTNEQIHLLKEAGQL
jgi:hypothetical protein